MTKEIILKVSDLEHMTRQPEGKRYALFCKEALGGGECQSMDTLGHLGDFETYKEAEEEALKHPHPVDIRFFPDLENKRPSEDFIKDLKEQFLK
jgi:hypothetical protein